MPTATATAASIECGNAGDVAFKASAATTGIAEITTVNSAAAHCKSAATASCKTIAIALAADIALASGSRSRLGTTVGRPSARATVLTYAPIGVVVMKVAARAATNRPDDFGNAVRDR